MCFAPILRNIHEISLCERLVVFIILVISAEPNVCSFSTAIVSADKYQGNFHDFKALFDLLKTDMVLYEEYCKAIDDPESSVVFSSIVRLAPFLLPTLLLAEEAGILILKPGLSHFSRLNLRTYSGGVDEKVVIAPKVTGPSPERIRAINDKLVKPYSTEELPYGSIIAVLSILFKKMRIPIKMFSNRPTTMDFRKFFGTCGVHEIAERFHTPRANPPISYTEPLELEQFALSYTGNLAPYNSSSLVSEAFESLTHNPFPSRNIKAHVLQQGQLAFEITDEQIESAETAGAVGIPAVPANDAIAEEAALDPGNFVRDNAVMNDIAMDDGATDSLSSAISEGHSDNGEDYENDGMNYDAEDYEKHQLDDGFGPNLGENPGDLPNPATRGTISARPSEVNSEADALANTGDITNDDSIFEDIAVNRGRKRGANEAILRLRESSMPNSKRQASAEKIAEIEAMLEDVYAKQDEMMAEYHAMNAKRNAEHQAVLEAGERFVDNQAKSEADNKANFDAMNAKFNAMDARCDANHQAVLEAMNVQADATNQAMLEAVKRDAANQIRLKAANQAIKATANELVASSQANSAAINLLLRRDKLRRYEIRRAALEKSKAEKCRARKTKNFRARMAGARTAGTRKARARNARAKKAKVAEAKEAEAGLERDAHSGTGDQSPPIQNSLVTRMASSMKFWNLSWRRAPQQNITDEPGYEGAMGAIPQLVVREPNTDTAEAEAEAKEEEPTPVEENPNDGNLLMIFAALVLGVVLIGAVFICLIVSVIDTPTSESSVDSPAIQYPPSFSTSTAKISDIDCEAGLEVAAAFCSESMCIEKVGMLCDLELEEGNEWQNERLQRHRKQMEDDIKRSI